MSAQEAYEDALQHGTIVSIEDATPSSGAERKGAKRRKVDFADMMQQSKGKHFSTDGQTDQFKARGVAPDEAGGESDDDDDDGAKGLDYISSKIGALSKHAKGAVSASASASTSSGVKSSVKEADGQGGDGKVKEKGKKEKKRKKHKALKNRQLLSFDMDEEG